MKVAFQLLFAGVVSIVSILLFAIFNQEPFLVPVSLDLFAWRTIPIPMIFFLATAFVVGMGVGGSLSFAYWISSKKEIRKIKKEYADREKVRVEPVRDESVSVVEIPTGRVE